MARSRNPTRVVLRNGVPTKVKVCPSCAEEKVCHEDVEQSDYHLRRERGMVVGWQSYCKSCAVAEQLRWRRRNPEKISALRARRFRERWRTDPEFRAKHQERLRSWFSAVKADPERLGAYRAAHRASARRTKERDPEAFLEKRRMEYAVRRERMGKPVRVQGGRGYGGRLEAWAFVSWLMAYQEATGIQSAEELAHDLGLASRRVSSLLSGAQEFVSFDVVDHALQHARFPVLLDGELIVRIDDLYPAEDEEVAA